MSKRLPIFFCFVGPVASGKSTICQALAAEDLGLMLSISTTTREKRVGEVDGVHYNFVEETEFERRVQAGVFFEHARFVGKRYGTEKSNIDRAQGVGRDLLLDIDIQGVRNIRAIYPEQVVVIFVCPPSMAELEQRLKFRHGAAFEGMAARLEIARQEILILRDEKFSDYLLINDKIENSLANALAIVRSERLRVRRVSLDILGDK